MADIVDVKISFAFKHKDKNKRFTWKAGRGISLQQALVTMQNDQYNYWNEDEKEAIVRQFKAINASVILKKKKGSL